VQQNPRAANSKEPKFEGLVEEKVHRESWESATRIWLLGDFAMCNKNIF
jgi:hypothetical protein